MTSGNFTSIEIETIIINREERQRKTLEHLNELAESIQTIGLINPVIVDKNSMILVAGERRLTAIRDILGWTHIQVQWTEDLSHDELYLIELEENVKRVSLTWRDQCEAVASYHAMRKSMQTTWTLNNTAENLGMNQSDVREKIEVHHAIEEGVPLIVDADKYSVARNILRRKRERALEAGKDLAASAIADKLSPKNLPAQTVSMSDEQLQHTTIIDDAELSEHILPVHSYVFPTPFEEYAQTYNGPKFNFLHCDFPYGINAAGHHQGAADKFGGYHDSKDVYFELLTVLKHFTSQHVSASAHMIFWFSMNYFDETKYALEEMGWTVNPFPLIWHRSDNSGIMPDPSRGGRRTYETAFHCTRGDRKVAKPVSMLVASPNVKNIHMSEKPLPVLAHFFRMYVDESTRMFDPTAGSGNAIAQALLSGADYACGTELDSDFATRAEENVRRLLNEE